MTFVSLEVVYYEAVLFYANWPGRHGHSGLCPTTTTTINDNKVTTVTLQSLNAKPVTD